MSVIEREREYTAPLPPPNDDPPKPTEADVLERAAYLLEEFDWTTGQYARSVDGQSTLPESGAAVAFCAAGATRRAASDLGWEPLNATSSFAFLLRLGWADITGDRHIATWNDTHTKEEVVSALREAAARARANV